VSPARRGRQALHYPAYDPLAPPCARRRLLREEFTSGRLDAAPSKAAVLGELCERLGFDAAAAAALHRQLYRERLEALLAEDKRIGGARPRRAPRRPGQRDCVLAAAARRSGAMQAVRMHPNVGLYAHPLQRPPQTCVPGMQQAAGWWNAGRSPAGRMCVCIYNCQAAGPALQAASTRVRRARAGLRADKGAEELDRLRRLLCIKRDDVRQVHRDICGRIYQQARRRPGEASTLQTSARGCARASKLVICHERWGARVERTRVAGGGHACRGISACASWSTVKPLRRRAPRKIARPISVAARSCPRTCS
jgi:hypothetical protein